MPVAECKTDRAQAEKASHTNASLNGNDYILKFSEFNFLSLELRAIPKQWVARGSAVLQNG
jgi:hypothetical protein